MRAIVLLLLLSLAACSNAQQKIGKEMEQEKTKLRELAKQDIAMVNQYPHKPDYFVQVNKSGCRIVVKINDIPLGYNFAEDDAQTMLYPVNDKLFASGEYSLNVEVYPLTNQHTVSAGTWVNLKVVCFPEKDGYDREIVAELNVPNDIGTQKLPIYCSSVKFTATLPFNHKKVLDTAKDLRKVPNLEAKVLAHYNMLRNMMIAGDFYGCHKMRLATTWVLTDMNYLTEDALNSVYLSPNKLFRFDCKVTNWEIAPIENYEMDICGHGKLVYLRRKDTMDEVLQVTYDEGEDSYLSTKFIALYMPQNSDELVELY